LAAIIVLVLVGVSIFLLNLDPHRYCGYIVDRLSQTLGRPVEAADVDLEWFPLSLTLNEIRVAESADFEGEYILSTQAIGIQVTLLSLLTGDPVVSEFQVERPTIYLREDSSGQWNITRLGQTPGSGNETEQEETSGGAPVETPVRNWGLNEGTVVVEENGKDVLLVTETERQRFVKTIEIPYQLFMRFRKPRPGVPKWLSPVYLINHRVTAKILQDKGLRDKTRMYEVRGISHMGGEYLKDVREGDTVILDLSRLMDALIDRLDDWVEKGIAPPPTKTDWLELGDVDGDGVNENPAIALPEVACPLGLYYPHPPSRGNNGDSWTSFAAFDGQSLEPLDGRGVFVDMNLNRYLDQREDVDQAWQRLGLLKAGERFSRSRYQACVEASVARLQQEKLITERVAARYLQEAAQVHFPGE